jgi:hypothetical protein
MSKIRYQATDAEKRLNFGASPIDGVAEIGISAALEPELSQRFGCLPPT